MTVVLLASGALFDIFANPISRLCFRLRRESCCPYCRYPLVDLPTLQCPECGGMLTPECLGQHSARTGVPLDDEAWRVRAAAVVAATVRVICMLAMMITVLVALSIVTNLIFWGEWSGVVVTVVLMSLWIGLGPVGFWLAAPVIGRVAVPRPRGPGPAKSTQTSQIAGTPPE